MVVSSVVGIFEKVVTCLPIIMCFQSLILDMAGNVGTQSLAVTIRVLMDETLTGRQKAELVLKEMRIGLCNGGLLGILSFVLIGLYIFLFKGKHSYLPMRYPAASDYPCWWPCWYPVLWEPAYHCFSKRLVWIQQ